VNAELAGLLREAGATLTGDWRDLIVLQNYTPLPMAHDPRGGAWEGKNGFNLAVLANGTPTWYCKCRTAGDAVLARETAIRERLAGTREHGLSVPTARGASSHRIAVQVGPFVNAVNYGRIIPKLSTQDFAALLTTTATGAAALATLALRDARDLLSPPAHVNLAGGVTAPARPQHGDLWWRNLLYAPHQLTALDFERYGTIWVPLFDDLHLIFTSLALRTPTGTTGALATLRSSTADAVACRSLLAARAHAESLDTPQQNAVLVYYLEKMVADLRTVAGDDRFAAPYVADLALARELLAAGTTNLLSA
jgi:hypothetical protein